MAAQKRTLAELAKLLGASLGDKKAEEVLRGAAQRKGLSTSEFGREQAMELLELIANEPGIVGISARFAKSRLLLNW